MGGKLGPTSDTSARSINARERELQALNMKKAGATFEEIATTLKYGNRGHAHTAVKRALDRITREPAADLIKLEEARLDVMLRSVWPKVLQGNVGAVDRALRIGESRRKLLGLDAPQRVDLGVPDVDLGAALAEIVGVMQGPPLDPDPALPALPPG